MNKIYKYEFVTGTVELEISEEWEKRLKDEDRDEYNSNKKETRRHLKLDASIDGTEWVRDDKADPKNCMEEETSKDILMDEVSRILTEKQFNAFEKICLNRYTEQEYADMVGISQQAAHRLVADAKERLIKYLKVSL